MKKTKLIIVDKRLTAFEYTVLALGVVLRSVPIGFAVVLTWFGEIAKQEPIMVWAMSIVLLGLIHLWEYVEDFYMVVENER